MPGILRGLDAQRRLIVPKETLLAAGIESGDMVEIHSDLSSEGNPIVILSKYNPGCLICRRTLTDRREYKLISGSRICKGCIEDIIRGEVDFK